MKLYLTIFAQYEPLDGCEVFLSILNSTYFILLCDATCEEFEDKGRKLDFYQYVG